jgi:hypothetical protein
VRDGKGVPGGGLGWVFFFGLVLGGGGGGGGGPGRGSRLMEADYCTEYTILFVTPG